MYCDWLEARGGANELDKGVTKDVELVKGGKGSVLVLVDALDVVVTDPRLRFAHAASPKRCSWIDASPAPRVAGVAMVVGRAEAKAGV